MSGWTGLYKYFLMPFCIATVILGQSPSFPKSDIPQDTPCSVSQHRAMASQAYCVPNSFQHHVSGQIVSQIDLPFFPPTIKEAEPVFRVTVFTAPAMRTIWRGVPSLRSPPACA